MSLIRGVYCTRCKSRVVLKPHRTFDCCQCPEGQKVCVEWSDEHAFIVLHDEDADYERLDPKTGKRIKKIKVF